jgi:hypothetical protein
MDSYEVLFKKRFETTQSLILGCVRRFVENQSALAPKLTERKFHTAEPAPPCVMKLGQ